MKSFCSSFCSIVLLAVLSFGLSCGLRCELGYGLKPTKSGSSPIALPIPLIEELILDAKAIQFNLQGNISQEMEIKKIVHTKGENTRAFIQPRVILNQADGSSWRISAHLGKSIHAKNGIKNSHKVTELELSDAVEMHQFHSGNHQQSTSTVLTNYLSIYPKTKTIYTRALVKIDNPHFCISAQGLSGNLNTQKIRLLNNVKTEYKNA